jgi:tetratricopeptide (TPR) repeat protein
VTRRILLVTVVFECSLSACVDLPQMRVLHDPLTPKEHATLGLTYEMQGRTDLAAREYERTLRREPGSVPALVGLGNLAFGKGALEEAETFYRKALAVDPMNAGANNNLAMVYLAQDTNLHEAEQLATQALGQSVPLQPYVLDTIAHIYARQGRFREALSALNNAEVLIPSNNIILHEQLTRLRQQLAASHPRAERGLEAEL